MVDCLEVVERWKSKLRELSKKEDIDLHEMFLLEEHRFNKVLDDMDVSSMTEALEKISKYNDIREIALGLSIIFTSMICPLVLSDIIPSEIEIIGAG